MSRVLLVDDEPHMLRILSSTLSEDGHLTMTAGGVATARQLLATNQYDCVITDHKMIDGAGSDVLKSAREFDPALSVIFLTAVASIGLAVESIRNGAFDFLTKPFTTEVVRAAVLRACEHTALVRENNLLRHTVVQLEGDNEIQGNSEAIRRLREVIGRVATTNATVLITGETGTGKEVVAREIHRASARRDEPFVSVNCEAFSGVLLESELFGHERDALPGADRPRQGLFEIAHHGTIFLDEIGELPLSAQAKLLRVVTDGLVTRVGSTTPRAVDVRVLAATRRDLQLRLQEGAFREDLYYRLNVVPITIPPLRERIGDVPTLCDVFLRQIARDIKVPVRRLSAEALASLQAYRYPGNIRELRNLLERASILSSGEELGPEHFPVPSAARNEPACPEIVWDGTTPIDLRTMLAHMESDLINIAIEASDGVRAEAARRLGLSRSDLTYKLAKRSEAAAS